MTRTRTGVRFVGARGNVATTAAGARGIARGTTDGSGPVAVREPYTQLDLPEATAAGEREEAGSDETDSAPVRTYRSGAVPETEGER